MNDIELKEKLLKKSNEFILKMEACTDELIKVLDKYYPDIRESWERKEPGSFEGRVFMTLYLELIHASILDTEKKEG